MGLSTSAREERKAKGLCITCGVQVARPDRATCVECGARNARKSSRWKNERLARGGCARCGSTPLESQTLCGACVGRNRESGRERVLILKQRVYDHYGSACACCGEANPAFLTIDHVNNDGAKHRREIGMGSKIYGWLIKHDFPPGFQLLCANCQLGKLRNNGVCPHQVQDRSYTEPSIKCICSKRSITFDLGKNLARM